MEASPTGRVVSDSMSVLVSSFELVVPGRVGR